jgi:hypothetical protein
MDAMRSWFFSNFQDPVEETPYISSEGGYQYLFGGPYDANEELDNRFEDIVPQEVRAKLGHELQDQSWEWAGRARDSDFDDYILENIAPPSEHIGRFTASIANIRKLVTTATDPSEEQFFRRMLYAGVITALETYLSDRFVSSITNNSAALRKFVETFPRFRKESISVSDVFKKSDHLERYVKTILVGEILWHRLVAVSNMFKDTFDVNIPKLNDMAGLLRAVEIRHDLVHRSGKDKDGVEHTITPENIEQIIKEAEILVGSIDLQREKFESQDGEVIF